VSPCLHFGVTGRLYLETVDKGDDWTQNRSLTVACSGLNVVLYRSSGDHYVITDYCIYHGVVVTVKKTTMCCRRGIEVIYRTVEPISASQNDSATWVSFSTRAIRTAGRLRRTDEEKFVVVVTQTVSACELLTTVRIRDVAQCCWTRVLQNVVRTFVWGRGITVSK